jgi:hypothetical protein
MEEFLPEFDVVDGEPGGADSRYRLVASASVGLSGRLFG